MPALFDATTTTFPPCSLPLLLVSFFFFLTSSLYPVGYLKWFHSDTIGRGDLAQEPSFWISNCFSIIPSTNQEQTTWHIYSKFCLQPTIFPILYLLVPVVIRSTRGWGDRLGLEKMSQTNLRHVSSPRTGHTHATRLCLLFLFPTSSACFT